MALALLLVAIRCIALAAERSDDEAKHRDAQSVEQQPRQCGQVWPAQAHWREGLVQEVPIKSPQVWPRHSASGTTHGGGSGGSGGGGGDGGGEYIFS